MCLLVTYLEIKSLLLLSFDVRIEELPTFVKQGMWMSTSTSFTFASLESYMIQSSRVRKRLIAFGWYGGKFSHLNWILPLLPYTPQYCEPFGGSAAILINRLPVPIETYNDIDGEVVNFFKVLRDKTDELIKAISLTPFSREEFRRAIEEPAEGLSDVERARRFYIRARQVRTGLAQTATPGRWAYCVKAKSSRRGMAGAVSRWLGGIEDLELIAERLLRVQIENDDAFQVIRRYDDKDTLFYCDPPYPHSSRKDKKAYAYELTEEDHVKLADLLHSVNGKVAISGYHCELMDELYKDWFCVEAPVKKCHSSKGLRQEVLWMNYDPREALEGSLDYGIKNR